MSSLQTSTGTSRRVVNFLSSASVMGVGVMLAVIALPPAAFANFDFCASEILDQGAPLGQQGPDLVITNMICTVDGTKAPYNFHNVYIFGNGTLTFNNATMDFYAANVLVHNMGVLKATDIGANNG